MDETRQDETGREAEEMPLNSYLYVLIVLILAAKYHPIQFSMQQYKIHCHDQFEQKGKYEQERD